MLNAAFTYSDGRNVLEYIQQWSRIINNTIYSSEIYVCYRKGQLVRLQ